MIARIAADAAVVLHLAFIVFVVLGGLLVLKWPRAAWFHLPAAAWGAAIELGGWLCPLTPLENRLRAAGGRSGYAEGFVEHYIVPLVYPAELSRSLQLVLGAAVILINLAVYGLAISRRSRRRLSRGCRSRIDPEYRRTRR
jgi:hypothetical protein